MEPFAQAYVDLSRPLMNIQTNDANVPAATSSNDVSSSIAETSNYIKEKLKKHLGRREICVANFLPPCKKCHPIIFNFNRQNNSLDKILKFSIFLNFGVYPNLKSNSGYLRM
jgi:hypothetical protein